MTCAGYLSRLRSEAIPNPAEIDSFAEAVILAWRGRELTATFAKYGCNPGAPGVLEVLHDDISRLAGSHRPDTYGPISGAIDDVMRAIRERKARGGGLSGISTGFPKLDELLDGLRPATLTVIGARPKQGKTGLHLSIIRNGAAFRHPHQMRTGRGTPCHASRG
jgi:replicative DNA helicase